MNTFFSKQLMDALPLPVFYKDLNGVYLGCNKAFCDFFGKKKEDMIGKSVYDMASKEIADKYKEKDDEVFRNKTYQKYEWKVNNAQGKIRNVVFHKSIFKNEDNEVVGLIGLFIDITEKKKTEEELKAKVAELEDFSKMAIGREMKMVELKNKINILQSQAKNSQRAA